MDLGDRVRILRKESDLSREELCKKINISYSALSKYETNSRFPDKDTLIKIADFFEVSVDYLLGRTIVRNPVNTIAFHSTDDEELTEEGLVELEKIKELLKLKYGKK